MFKLEQQLKTSILSDLKRTIYLPYANGWVEKLFRCVLFCLVCALDNIPCVVEPQGNSLFFLDLRFIAHSISVKRGTQ